MCMYNWFTLLYTWNSHNMWINYTPIKIKKKKKQTSRHLVWMEWGPLHPSLLFVHWFFAWRDRERWRQGLYFSPYHRLCSQHLAHSWLWVRMKTTWGSCGRELGEGGSGAITEVCGCWWGTGACLWGRRAGQDGPLLLRVEQARMSGLNFSLEQKWGKQNKTK